MNGKQVQSAVLNKVFVYDYFHMTKTDAETAEFNASAIYGRILSGLVVITSQRLGLEEKSGGLFYDRLVDLKHQFCTVYKV